MSLEKAIADVVKSVLLTELEPLLKKQGENYIMSEAAVMEMLKVSPQTLKRMRDEGLESYKPMGSKRYYYSKDVDAFIKRNGIAL